MSKLHSNNTKDTTNNNTFNSEYGISESCSNNNKEIHLGNFLNKELDECTTLLNVQTETYILQ